MKHFFRALPLWALLLGVASCDKEDIVAGGNGAEASGELVPMTFTALAPQTGQAQTRTELQPGVEGEDGQTTYAVYWNAGDQIGIYDGESFRPFNIDLQEGTAPTANFSGEASPGAGSYLAFYPYDAEGVTYKDGAIHFTLPDTQTAQEGSFAPGTNPACAQTSEAGGQLTFRNAAALVKFTLTAADAEQVSNAVLTDKGNKPLAGGFSLSVGGDVATLKADDSGNTFDFVKLKGPFEKNTDADYLFVVACGEKQLESGFTLAFNLKDGGQKTLTASGGLGEGKSLEAGVITNLGEITLDDVPVTGVPISYGGESSAITATEIWAD